MVIKANTFIKANELIEGMLLALLPGRIYVLATEISDVKDFGVVKEYSASDEFNIIYKKHFDERKVELASEADIEIFLKTGADLRGIVPKARVLAPNGSIFTVKDYYFQPKYKGGRLYVEVEETDVKLAVDSLYVAPEDGYGLN